MHYSNRDSELSQGRDNRILERNLHQTTTGDFSLNRSILPSYAMFERLCQSGLYEIRPLRETPAFLDDWNFGAAWPPSYRAYGRFRSVITLQLALALGPRRVLEVAAGDGALCACLADRGIEVVANELRGEYLRSALTSFRNSESVQVEEGNLFELDAAKMGTFDLVIACEVIEHVAHPDELLRNIRAFLSPGGRILLTTPNGDYLRNRLPHYLDIPDPAALESKQFRPDADGHLFLLNTVELGLMARLAGLKIEMIAPLATPFITGHCGLASLEGRISTRLLYLMERCCALLPFFLRRKLSFWMVAVLTAA